MLRLFYGIHMMSKRLTSRRKFIDFIALILFHPITFIIQRSSSPRVRWALWKFAEKYINWRGFSTIAKIEDNIGIACNTRDLIQKYLIYFGVWEPHITAFVKRRLKQGGVFIDVGANIGYYSLLTSKLCEEVVAIEAASEIFYKIKKNIEYNEISNIRLVHIAVSDKIQETIIYISSDANIGATTLFSERFSYKKGDLQEEIVRTAPFKDIILLDEKKNVRLIKIDIEGSEYYVLKDLLINIDEFGENIEILVEISPDDIRRCGGKIEDVMHKFYNKGFFSYVIRNIYDVDDYVNQVNPDRPKRLYDIPDKQVDIIFSRIDADFL